MDKGCYGQSAYLQVHPKRICVAAGVPPDDTEDFTVTSWPAEIEVGEPPAPPMQDVALAVMEQESVVSELSA